MTGVSSTLAGSRVGMVIEGKYEVLRLLGAGGMGEVYEARHVQIARRVALKFLLPEVAAEPGLLERFRNEARAAGALEHENVAAVYDTGVAGDGAPYFVMEYLQGSDCADVLDAMGTFSPARAASTIVQVCRGLAVAHARGIIHRDLKPANLFLSQRADGSELVKILDFGIAKLQRQPQAHHSTGANFGTPFYMAPERARGDRDIDLRADIYALGVILYELLSGQRPYDGTSVLQILHCILTREPTPLAELRRDIPATLCAVVQRAMARSREERFASALELERALQPYALAGPAAELDATVPERARETRRNSEPHNRPQTGVRAIASQPRMYSYGRAIAAWARAPHLTRRARWAIAVFAATVLSVWLLRAFELSTQRTSTRSPVIISPQPAPGASASVRSIDRPNTDPLPAAGGPPPIEPGAQVLEQADRVRPARHGVARMPAPKPGDSNAAERRLDPASKPAAAHDTPRARLRIDHASPYQ